MTDAASVVEAMRELERLGLNHGTAGNIGVRVENGILVTPSGIPPRSLRPDDIVLLGPDGSPRASERAPTSEWRIHVDVLAARAEVGAVVHTHSPEATAAACLRRPLPAVHYTVARVGLPVVPCAEYATFGTAELSANVLAALGPGLACLMANHGMVALGQDLDAAMALAVEVEWLARVRRLAVAVGPEVHVLPDDEIARVAAKFRTYGQPPESDNSRSLNT
jgi:L-fuculose-phosphate aldolase